MYLLCSNVLFKELADHFRESLSEIISVIARANGAQDIADCDLLIEQVF